MSMYLARRILNELRNKANAANKAELKELTKREIELLEHLSREVEHEEGRKGP